MSGFDIMLPEVSIFIPLAVILGNGPLHTSLNVVSHLRDNRAYQILRAGGICYADNLRVPIQKGLR